MIFLSTAEAAAAASAAWRYGASTRDCLLRRENFQRVKIAASRTVLPYQSI